MKAYVSFYYSLKNEIIHSSSLQIEKQNNLTKTDRQISSAFSTFSSSQRNETIIIIIIPLRKKKSRRKTFLKKERERERKVQGRDRFGELRPERLNKVSRGNYKRGKCRVGGG